MLPEDSPFRPAWCPDPDAFPIIERPPLPFPLDGTLAWLRAQPEHAKWPVGTARVKALPRLVSACDALGLTLPPTFTAFLESGELQRRVRSSSGCYLDVARAPVPSPTGEGHLVRFLNDQEGIAFWYLYLPADSQDHAVVISTEYLDPDDADEGDSDDDDGDADVDADELDGEDDSDEDDGEIQFEGESFEAFLCRYWLENEINFARGGPVPGVDPGYVRQWDEFTTAYQRQFKDHYDRPE